MSKSEKGEANVLKTIGRFFLLTLIAFTLYALNPWQLSLSPALQTVPLLILLAALIAENFLFGFVVAWALRPLPQPSPAGEKHNLAT
jgi:hypothetical protein